MEVHKYETGTVDRNSSIESFHFGSGQKHQARIAHEKKIQRFGKSPFSLFLFCIVHFSPLSVIYGIVATCSSSKVRGIEWSIRDFARPRDSCLKIRDRDSNFYIESEPETRDKKFLSRSKH